METIKKHFSSLNKDQIDKLSQLFNIYQDWNSKINVISRKDFDNFYVNHVLHSLSILKFFNFVDGTKFLDVGTGGGFPGIPLAICLPNCQLVLTDSIAKKMKVVEDIASQLELKNVTCITGRAEQIKGQFDFITGRAVTALPDFANLIRNKISKTQKNAFPNGILYLKGGEFDDELVAVNMESEVHRLNLIFEEDFFETKKLVYLF
jgi:16S rRNA (guanine527-N7)-methyltransferase